MKTISNRSLRSSIALGGAALAIALSLSACGAGNEDNGSGDGGNDGGSGSDLSGTLNGAGSSAQDAAMGAWRAGFQSANSDVTVNYDPSGSSAGREQFIAGAIQFAGSDSFLSDDELASAEAKCGGPAIEYPVYVSPIAVIYNLDGVDNLQLTPDVIGSIFAGDITKWNDPAIAATNDGVDLPDQDINAVHRSDGSGTTANFTEYLDKASGGSWSYGTVDEWPIKSGEGADGTSGVVAAVKNGAGSIGYADESQAGDLGQASVQVGDTYAAPSADGAAAVLDDSGFVSGRDESTDLAVEVNRTSTADGVYPIILVSYQMVCSTYADQGTVDLVKAFAEYVISSDGQDAAAKAAGSAPITDDLRTKAQAAIDTIAVK